MATRHIRTAKPQHRHTCKPCGFTWWHVHPAFWGNASYPQRYFCYANDSVAIYIQERAHRCPKCHREQYFISGYGP